MASEDGWRSIVASSLDWEQAHASFDSALANLAPELRGKRIPGLEHSAWELLDHIRRTQADLLEFIRNSQYHEIKWPDDYWPGAAAPPTEAAWDEAIEGVHRDRAELAAYTVDTSHDLTAKIPHGTGQTYLRTILVAVDHCSYHVGQIISLRRLLGAWPPA